MENQQLVSLHDSVPTHRSVLVKDFLAKNNLTTPELPLAWLQLIITLRLKSELKGRHFYDTTDIIKNATEELKRLSHSSFQECSHHLYRLWQMHVVAHGNYFAGN
jgi:hypothetical protein